MSDTREAIRGRCLCGSVEFSLTPPTNFCAHCHCESCRLSSGAAFVTWTSVPSDRFALTAGEEHLKWYRSSDHILWGFCGNCGSSMLYRADKAGHHESPKLENMYVSVGSLIDPMDQPPKVHVSYEERLAWMHAKDGLAKHRGKTDDIIED